MCYIQQWRKKLERSFRLCLVSLSGTAVQLHFLGRCTKSAPQKIVWATTGDRGRDLIKSWSGFNLSNWIFQLYLTVRPAALNTQKARKLIEYNQSSIHFNTQINNLIWILWKLSQSASMNSLNIKRSQAQFDKDTQIKHSSYHLFWKLSYQCLL